MGHSVVNDMRRIFNIVRESIKINLHDIIKRSVVASVFFFFKFFIREQCQHKIICYLSICYNISLNAYTYKFYIARANVYGNECVTRHTSM